MTWVDRKSIGPLIDLQVRNLAYQVARRKVPDDDAADVAHDALEAVIRHFQVHAAEVESFDGYIVTAVHHQVTHYYAKQAARHGRESETASVAADRGEDRVVFELDLLRCIARLPARFRDTAFLFAVADMSLQQMSEALPQFALNTLKTSHLPRIRELLVECLKVDRDQQ